MLTHTRLGVTSTPQGWLPTVTTLRTSTDLPDDEAGDDEAEDGDPVGDPPPEQPPSDARGRTARARTTVTARHLMKRN
ncbi:hypothetical protein BN12_1650002 [Nostocoides japonicum T1-X7]|uniref:Uncharacterized protein n=1 Tax=Nostocoides japonicum T1-X7 TaxID=1194083 RepID=A0A077LTW9_9MICO|nr:hypothetical protein BN12_1650002 [Tetrasphaera japonica T1-X7]